MQLSYHIASSLEYKTEKRSHILKTFSNPLLLNVHTQLYYATVREIGNQASRINGPAVWIKKNIEPHFSKMYRWFLLDMGEGGFSPVD